MTGRGTDVMSERVALVTGAGSGIGRASAILFAERGAKVAVADVDVAGGEETVALIESAGGTAFFSRCDVTDEAQVADLVARTTSTYGRLDYAHNNAGIIGVARPLAEYTAADFDRVVQVNLRSVFLGMRYQLPVMIAQGYGAIVNTSSAAGVVGFPSSGAYVASKHGVSGLTKSAALDVARAGVRVNALCPGVVNTAMLQQSVSDDPAASEMTLAGTPMGRWAEPREMAEVAVWLCSDAASFVTGHLLSADGGLSAQ